MGLTSWELGYILDCLEMDLETVDKNDFETDKDYISWKDKLNVFWDKIELMQKEV